MPATYYRDAFFIGIGGAGALIGLQTVIQSIAQHWPTPHRGAPGGVRFEFRCVRACGSDSRHFAVAQFVVHGICRAGGHDCRVVLRPDLA